MEAGIEPERLLFSRRKLIKDFMLLTSWGIRPESKLQNKCTNVHFVRFLKVERIGPVKLFHDKSRPMSLGRFPISGGMEPEKSFRYA